MVIPANNLDDIYTGKSILTTGDVATILQISQNSVIRTCNRNEIPSWKVPGSRNRRVQVDDLVRYMLQRADGKKYLRQQLLHFMEVFQVNPTVFGIEDLVGREGLRFQRQQDIYTTGEAASLMSCSIPTVNRLVDNNQVDSFSVPGTDHRRVTASGITEVLMRNNIPLLDGESVTSPVSTNYPEPYLGPKRETFMWPDGVIIVQGGGQSILYRNRNETYEVSIRRDKSGLYLMSQPGEVPRIDLILLGESAKHDNVFPAGEHLKRVLEFLGMATTFLCGSDRSYQVPKPVLDNSREVVSASQAGIKQIYQV